MWGGNSNTIRGNTLINNYCGLNLIETTNNLITEDNVLNSSFSNQLTHGGVGMAFWGASGNLIFNNNLIDNAKQVYDDSYNSPFSINSWDNGSIGNYWSDHKGNGVYVIDNKNTDHYPVTNPIDIYATPNPTSTLTPSPPSNDRNPPHLDPTYYLIPVSGIVAVIILSVLFYRRHRKTANLKQ